MYTSDVITTLHQCDALIAAAQAFKDQVRSTGRAYIGGSDAGLSLVNAMFDLTDCDELYDLAGDIEFDLFGAAPEHDPVEINALAERRYYEARV